ncbi:MAG: hypothetical protein ACK5SZ_01600, partial [bacterium]
MDKARLSKLVKQHATTAKLLGAESVPSYRKSARGTTRVIDDEVAKPVVATPVKKAAEKAPVAGTSSKSSGGMIELPAQRKRGGQSPIRCLRARDRAVQPTPGNRIIRGITSHVAIHTTD